MYMSHVTIFSILKFFFFLFSRRWSTQNDLYLLGIALRYRPYLFCRCVAVRCSEYVAVCHSEYVAVCLLQWVYCSVLQWVSQYVVDRYRLYLLCRYLQVCCSLHPNLQTLNPKPYTHIPKHQSLNHTYFAGILQCDKESEYVAVCCSDYVAASCSEYVAVSCSECIRWPVPTLPVSCSVIKRVYTLQ